MLVLPALQALSKHYNGNLCIVGLEYVSPLFFNAIDAEMKYLNIHQDDDNSWNFDPELLINMARDSNCDFFISLNPWLSKSLKMFIKRFGYYRTVGFASCFGVNVNWEPDRHAIYNNFSVVKLINPNLSVNNFCQPFEIPEDTMSNIIQFKHKISGDYKLLVIHMETKEEKCAPNEFWVDFVNRVLKLEEKLIVISISRSKHLNVEHSRFLSTCNLSLEACLGLTSISDIFVGVDSCFMHMANFSMVPSVGIFVNSSPIQFGINLSPVKYNLRYKGDQDSSCIKIIFEVRKMLSIIRF